MAFSIQKTALMDLVQKAYPVVPSRTSLQVLNNFKMSFVDGNLNIVASDLDNFVRVTGPIQGEGDVEIAVNARKLFEVLKEIGDELLQLKVVDNTLHISSETGFSCMLMGVDLREFPHFPESDFAERLIITREDFNALVSKSSFAVSRDESRACLCGVLWEISAERTGMVATDGHRLGASFIHTALGTDQELSAIVPPKSLNHIMKTIELSDVDDVAFSIFDKHILFSIEGFTLSTKLIDGPYPDYEKGIPREFAKVATIDRVNLYNAIKRVSVLSNRKTSLIKCVFSEGQLALSANNREIGAQGNQILPVAYSGEELIIGFNSAYLLEILSVVNTDKITLEMNNQVSAAVLHPLNEEESSSDDVFLIMPLRIFE